MSDLPQACQHFMDVLERKLDVEGPCEAELAEARQHAAECSECATLAGALEMMSSPLRLDAAEHEAYKGAALAGEQIARQQRSRQRIVWALAATLAGLALAAVIWRFSEPPAAPLTRAQLALASAWCGQSELRSGVALSPCQGAGPLELRDGTRLRLDAQGVIRLLRADASEQRLRLERGRVVLQVAKGLERRFVVETAYCEAKVLGTIFEVRVVDGDAEVSVVEGTVEVGAKVLPQPRRLPAGWKLRVKKRKPRQLSASQRAEIVRALAPRGMPSDASVQMVKTDVRPPDSKAATPTKPARPPGLEQLLTRARRCRAARDRACARKSYLQLQRHHAKAAVAITSLVALAELELEMGKAKAALAHSRRYRRLRPAGALVREALYAELRALRALGRREAERRALENFLQRFPSSIHASTLRARLDQLKR